MSFLKKYLSYLSVINVRNYESLYNGVLEINWVNGKKVLDTQNTNYSYGNLGKVLNKALMHTQTNFLNKNQHILVLGIGGGDVIKQLREEYKSEALITAIDIDPVIIEIAINEFNIVPNKRLTVLKEDAELFVKYTKESYDLIIVDLFNDIELPSFLFRKSFIENINSILKPKSSVIFNTFVLNELQEKRNNNFLNLLEEHFSLQSFPKLYGHNHLIVAKK